MAWCWILLPYQWSSLWVAHWRSLAWLPQLWSLARITRLRRFAQFTQLGCLFAFLPLLGLLWLGVFLGFWGLRRLCLLGFLPGWRYHGFTSPPSGPGAGHFLGHALGLPACLDPPPALSPRLRMTILRPPSSLMGSSSKSPSSK